MEEGEVRPSAKLTANPAIVPAAMMTANIRSFLSSLAFMMHPPRRQADYTRSWHVAAHHPRNDRVGRKTIGFALARVQNAVSSSNRSILS
jgi:hypothetical protein